MKVKAPPIKSQGIKTKLVPWIYKIIPRPLKGLWIEPFMGTGIVAFNFAPKHALLCDSNPHLINFYNAVSSGNVTPEIVRDFLSREGAKLLENGESHYYAVRERFNREKHVLDFLFLNRAGFNGMIRFNRKGELNVPFCRKPERFSKAYVTKIVNQVSYVFYLLKKRDFVFKCQSYKKTIEAGGEEDVIYCDPPYIDRHADYYNGWNEAHEKNLCRALSATSSQFILSTWHHNDFRKNQYIDSLWNGFNISTHKHFYHVGASEKNRNFMVESIVTNYTPICERQKPAALKQPWLLEKQPSYSV